MKHCSYSSNLIKWKWVKSKLLEYRQQSTHVFTDLNIYIHKKEKINNY